MSENERDAHIRAIYFILLPFVALSIIGLFVGLLAWNVASEPDTEINAITISLSVIQVVLALFAFMLGVAAIFGFWAIRGAAVASAKREARAYLDEKAASMFEAVARTKQTNGRIEKPYLPDNMNQEEVLSQAEEEVEQ
ncbi:hypothetical protein ACN2XU_23880 [Primorskyibacter sp. 2E107]